MKNVYGSQQFSKNSSKGVVSYLSAEYVYHEYGQNEEALYLCPIVFYKSNIAEVVSLEDVDGPFGHFTDKYGLLEKKCLEWGTVLIEEVLESEDDIQIYRMLVCINDHFESLAKRGADGMKDSISKDTDDQGPVYLIELEGMLDSLVKYSENDEIVREAQGISQRIKDIFC